MIEMLENITVFLNQTITYCTVYTLASLGIIIAGRSGIFNISAEGAMLSAASVGFITAWQTNNWLLGFLLGAIVGGLFGLVLVFLHEKFHVDQFILGICLVTFGMGFSNLYYKLIVGITLMPPLSPPVPNIYLPLISKIPIISAFFNHDVIVYIMYAAVAFSFWFFYRTKLGLETRAIGESPRAVDVVGVNVTRRRYIATIVGSTLIGLAGAYLSIGITETFVPNISQGRGFMAVGLAIFCSWKPQRALWGGLLFAAIEVISYQLQLFSDAIPFQFFLMLPFVMVFLVMILFRKHVEFPASIGEGYSRE